VIPSLLNLFEILRARLLSGVSVGARLAELAGQLANLAPNTEGISPIEYAHLRNMVVVNQQNPLQYLFDGGSVTELALEAEDALFVRQTWDNVRQSFEFVDRLISAWETAQFRRKYGV
jgi:hypothetical protein